MYNRIPWWKQFSEYACMLSQWCYLSFQMVIIIPNDLWINAEKAICWLFSRYFFLKGCHLSQSRCLNGPKIMKRSEVERICFFLLKVWCPFQFRFSGLQGHKAAILGPSEGYKGTILEVIPAEFSAALPPICTIVEASAKLLKDQQTRWEKCCQVSYLQ